MPRKKNIDRDRILDAAEQVVLKSGAHALTLDMVAAEAGISKGGLTYTFASKEALLSGLLDRDLSRFRTNLNALRKSTPDMNYLELRTLLDICRCSQAAERRVGPQLAAIMHAPAALKPVRSYLNWMLSKFSSDSESGRRARLVFFATQGLFLLQGFGLLALSDNKRQDIIDDFVAFLTSLGA